MSEIITLNEKLHFTSGYKHQVKKDFHVFIPSLIRYGHVEYDFVILHNGNLTVLAGFGWDGASGLTYDTDSSYRASLVHDVLYRLMRQELLPPIVKEIADDILEFVCKKDGMWEWRAEGWHDVVDVFGDPSIEPRNKIKVRILP